MSRQGSREIRHMLALPLALLAACALGLFVAILFAAHKIAGEDWDA